MSLCLFGRMVAIGAPTQLALDSRKSVVFRIFMQAHQGAAPAHAAATAGHWLAGVIKHLHTKVHQSMQTVGSLRDALSKKQGRMILDGMARLSRSWGLVRARSLCPDANTGTGCSDACVVDLPPTQATRFGQRGRCRSRLAPGGNDLERARRGAKLIPLQCRSEHGVDAVRR